MVSSRQSRQRGAEPSFSGRQPIADARHQQHDREADRNPNTQALVGRQKLR
jgi:hypothetical protein